MNDQQKHELIGELTSKVADLLHSKLKDSGLDPPEAVFVASTVAARIAASVLMGNIEFNSLNDCEDIRGGFIELFTRSCDIVRDARLAEEATAERNGPPVVAPHDVDRNLWDVDED